MSFDPNKLATSYVQRIRLLTGDLYETPLLEDSVYDYLYMTNNTNELEAAIEAVETIITMLVMNPNDEVVGSNGQKISSLADFQNLLVSLKARRGEDALKVRRTPIIIKSDRSNWDDLNKLFDKE